LTSPPLTLSGFQDGFVWQKRRFCNGLPLWQVWSGRILKEQLTENQTASLTRLSRLPDSRLTRFKKIQFRFNRRLNHRSSPVHD
jgi:hypothetical protein